MSEGSAPDEASGPAPESAAHPGLAQAVAARFAALARDGTLSEPRPGQLRMALAIASGIEDRRNVVAAAGTGTGKTWAYIVPCILSGRRVVVSTGTKLLQEQLANRDLPTMSAHLGRTVDWQVLKGRSSYLCRQRLAELDPGADDDQLASLRTWAAETQTGDRDELPGDPGDASWRKVSIGSDECPGGDRCPSGSTCFSELARLEAARRDVVVTNHHLYVAGTFSSQRILPPHDLVVFDESHLLEEVVRETLSTRVDPARLASMLRHGPGVDQATRAEAVALTRALHDALAPLVGTWSWDLPPAVAEALSVAEVQLKAIAATARRFAKEAEHGDSARWRRLAQGVALAIENVHLSHRSELGRGVWVEGTPRRPVLRSATAQLDPAKMSRLWDGRVAVLTSATWTDAVGTSLCLDATNPSRIEEPSPFAYREQGLLYCASHLPDPRSKDWYAGVHEELLSLITAAGGRTMALFTSHAALNAAIEAIGPRVPGRLLVQGQLGRRELTAQFAADPSSCAFGTIGLSHGIDVPGPSLGLVTLDRLPFPPVDEPHLAIRRAARPETGFRDVDLPHASAMLAQIAGRLIRTADDRGVFAVLDRRLAKAGYRRELLAGVPSFRRTIDRADAEQFLARDRGTGAGADLEVRRSSSDAAVSPRRA